MLPDTGIDDVKKQRNAEHTKHINDPVLSSLKMEGIRLLFIFNFTKVLPRVSADHEVPSSEIQWQNTNIMV
jgi:hypothetical protein